MSNAHKKSAEVSNQDQDQATSSASTEATNAAAAKAPERKGMGKKLMFISSAMTTVDAPHSAPAAANARKPMFDRLPQISAVAGSALQADIEELNRATVRLLKTAARLGGSEPLSPLLLGTSQDMIDLFFDPANSERLLSQAIGFPLVQLRIHDVGVMRQMLTDGMVSASSVHCLTKTFPLEVHEAATRQSRSGNSGNSGG